MIAIINTYNKKIKFEQILINSIIEFKTTYGTIEKTQVIERCYDISKGMVIYKNFLMSKLENGLQYYEDYNNIKQILKINGYSPSEWLKIIKETKWE